MSRYLVGVDIGGTFTDCAVIDEQGVTTAGKVPSTPGDFSEGFFAAIQDAAGRLGLGLDDLLAGTRRLAHGTTVGINALVTRSGCRVGLLATRGHADALWIRDNTGRTTGATVDQILDYSASETPHDFVSRDLVREVVERIDFSGEVVVAIDRDQVRQAVRELRDAGAEAIAISLLWSFANSEHERLVEEIVRDEAPELYVSASYAVAPRIGEYPRTATTVFNAYIGPLMRSYVDRIADRGTDLGYERPVFFATCSGGLVHADVVRGIPLLTAKSGPVAGVVATTLLGAQAGTPDVIATDMGGTTLDVCVVVGGEPAAAESAVIERHEAHLRVVDVESIGAGGGSIGWFDAETGWIRVGPQSAGSVPGPACYGRGGDRPTVTDADLILGILSPDALLGGDLKLDRAAAEAAVGGLAEQAGLGLMDTAAGIVEIVDAQMEDLVRRMTIQQGSDPREFELFGFGGGAAAHASLYGRGLGVSRLVIPLADLASVWSAVGVAASDLVRVYERPVYLGAPFDHAVVAREVAALEEVAREDAKRFAPNPADVRIRRSADLRYGLQVFEVESPVPDGMLDSDQAMEEVVRGFERSYARRYGEGSGYADAGVIMTALRVEARVPADHPELRIAARERLGGIGEARTGERDVYWWEGREHAVTPVFDGSSMPIAASVAGPAIIEYPDTTAVVRPGQSAFVNDVGSLVVELGGDRR